MRDLDLFERGEENPANTHKTKPCCQRVIFPIKEKMSNTIQINIAAVLLPLCIFQGSES